jgi:hypothetical protein
MTQHLSAFDRDRLALGALDADGAERARSHLEACAACRADNTADAEARAYFTQIVLPRGAPRASRARMWFALALPALAAAAIVLLVIGRRGRTVEENGLAIKGGAVWHVFANRAGNTFAVHDGDLLAAGDRIRFTVVPAGARYVLVGSIDGAGTATIYVPYGGTQSEPVAPEGGELPGSIELDAAPGPERLFAVLSDDPIDARIVDEKLRELGRGGGAAIRDARELDLEALPCVQLTLWFDKQVPR